MYYGFQKNRSQFRNRQKAICKITNIIKCALNAKITIKKATNLSRKSQEKRITEKKKRGE